MDRSRKAQLEEIMTRMGEINRLFATSRDQFLARFELSRPQAELLFAVKHDPMTISELAKAFRITSSAVSQMVSQLEEKRLVVRVADEDDKRVTRVEMSKVTRKHFAKLRQAFISHLDTKFAGLSERELDQLEKILTKITKSLGKESLWKD